MTVNIWCENWHYYTLWVWMMVEYSRIHPAKQSLTPLSQPLVSDHSPGLRPQGVLWNVTEWTQSPADKALGYAYVLGCQLPASKAEGVFSFAFCTAPHMPRSLPKTQAPGRCDLMSYNCVIFKSAAPSFCLLILRIFKHSTKDQKSPKALGVAYSVPNLVRS